MNAIKQYIEMSDESLQEALLLSSVKIKKTLCASSVLA